MRFSSEKMERMKMILRAKEKHQHRYKRARVVTGFLNRKKPQVLQEAKVRYYPFSGKKRGKPNLLSRCPHVSSPKFWGTILFFHGSETLS